LSIRDDIVIVKDEITAEEQFLTGFIKTEKFVKKYKTLFLSVFALIAVGVACYIGYDFYEQDRVVKANDALNRVLKNPSDKNALTQLQSKSPKLYEMYVFMDAVSRGDQNALKTSSASSNSVVSDLAKYQHAALDANENELKAYASDKDALLRDFANFLLAQKAIDKNSTKSAVEYLAKIPTSSSLKEQALFLEHLLIKTNKSK